MTSLDDAINTLVAQANADNRDNTLKASAIRPWLVEFLDTLDEEFARFPEERELPQWNLLAADFNHDEPLAVAVVVLDGDKLTLYSGQGEFYAHFDFGEADDFPEDEAADIEAAAREAFRLGQFSFDLDRETVRGWS